MADPRRGEITMYRSCLGGGMGPQARHGQSGLTVLLFRLLAGYFIVTSGYLVTTGMPALQAGGVTAVALFVLALCFLRARM